MSYSAALYCRKPKIQVHHGKIQDRRSARGRSPRANRRTHSAPRQARTPAPCTHRRPRHAAGPIGGGTLRRRLQIPQPTLSKITGRYAARCIFLRQALRSKENREILNRISRLFISMAFDICRRLRRRFLREYSDRNYSGSRLYGARQERQARRSPVRGCACSCRNGNRSTA